MSHKTNRILTSLAAWVFGLATSILFISLWGRAVVIDTDELGDSLRPMSQSEQVAGAFSEWMTTELVESGVPVETAEEATDAALVGEGVSVALEDLVVEVVDAAASDNAAGAVVDVASTLQPAVPSVTAALVGSGMNITESQVSSVIAGLDPLVIRRPGEPPVIGTSSSLATRLGTAAILAVLFQVIFGSVYVLTASDRLKRARTLLSRFALTGLSFAVLLKLGSWMLDPEGGRAPVSESLSLLANSKWALPAVIGAVGAVAAFMVWLVRAARLSSPDPVPTPIPEADPRPTVGASIRRSG